MATRVTVKIGSESRPLRDLSENWVIEQINGGRERGEEVCIVVKIQGDGIMMVLATPACRGNGGGRPPTSREAQVLELWAKLGLNRPGFSGGQAVAFLKQLRRFF